MLFQAALMGANFRPKETREVLVGLPTGQELSLEREPENPYDPNAVKVIFDAGTGDSGPKPIFLGFVEKAIAEEIAPLLDRDCTATCHIIGWLGTIKPHLEIEIDL